MNNELVELPLKDIDANSLSDINSIDVDFNMPMPERIRNFIVQIKSPYLFRVKGKAVKVVFDNSSAISFEEGVRRAIINIVSTNP